MQTNTVPIHISEYNLIQASPMGPIPIKYDPDEAEIILLGINQKNRRLRPRRAEEYARAISKNEWRSDHPDSIIFDREGHLLNGQHRLTAITIARPRFLTMNTILGADPAIMEYLDMAIPRVLADRVRFTEDQRINTVIGQIINSWYITNELINFGPNRKKVKVLVNEAEAIWEKNKIGIDLIATFSVQPKKKTDIKWNRVPAMIALSQLANKFPSETTVFISEINKIGSTNKCCQYYRDHCIRKQYNGGFMGFREWYGETLFVLNHYINKTTFTEIKTAFKPLF